MTAESPAARALEAVKASREFVKWCLQQSWEGCDIDGGEAQDEAERLGLIHRTEGGYNPEIHGESDFGLEPGDPWFEFPVGPVPALTEALERADEEPVEWRCSNCGDAYEPTGSWRHAHNGPEHKCDGVHAQAGHFQAEYVGGGVTAAAIKQRDHDLASLRSQLADVTAESADWKAKFFNVGEALEIATKNEDELRESVRAARSRAEAAEKSGRRRVGELETVLATASAQRDDARAEREAAERDLKQCRQDLLREGEQRGFERGVRAALEKVAALTDKAGKTCDAYRYIIGLEDTWQQVHMALQDAESRVRSLLPPSDETPHTPPTPGGANKETD